MRTYADESQVRMVIFAILIYANVCQLRRGRCGLGEVTNLPANLQPGHADQKNPDSNGKPLGPKASLTNRLDE